MSRVVTMVNSCILYGSMFFVAWKDWKYRKISNRSLFFLLCMKILLLSLDCIFLKTYILEGWKAALEGMVFSSAMFFLFYLFIRKGIGAGDVKLFAVLGFYMGSWKLCITAFLSFLISAIYGIWGVARKGKNIKQEIPLAPFVLIAMVFTDLFHL